jgi:hypothetical protein
MEPSPEELAIMTNAARWLAGAALLLWLTGIAPAQNAAPATAPAAPTAAAPAKEAAAPPMPEPGSGPQDKCIAQKEGFTRLGKGIGYAMQLTNKCEARLKCKVYAQLSSAKGSSRGHGTLILAPQSKGAAATKTFAMRAKMAGGMIQLSRACKVF